MEDGGGPHTGSMLALWPTHRREVGDHHTTRDLCFHGRPGTSSTSVLGRLQSCQPVQANLIELCGDLIQPNTLQLGALKKRSVCASVGNSLNIGFTYVSRDFLLPALRIPSFSDCLDETTGKTFTLR